MPILIKKNSFIFAAAIVPNNNLIFKNMNQDLFSFLDRVDNNVFGYPKVSTCSGYTLVSFKVRSIFSRMVSFLSSLDRKVTLILKNCFIYVLVFF